MFTKVNNANEALNLTCCLAAHGLHLDKYPCAECGQGPQVACIHNG